MKYLENNTMVTKEDIEKKLEIVHRQMKHCGYDQYYLEPLLEREKQFFSDNEELYSKTIHDINGLVSEPKVWDGVNKFIEEFKNFNEYYHFVRELMKDINTYNEERLNNKN
jgi:hypothetical protein